MALPFYGRAAKLIKKAQYTLGDIFHLTAFEQGLYGNGQNAQGRAFRHREIALLVTQIGKGLLQVQRRQKKE